MKISRGLSYMANKVVNYANNTVVVNCIIDLTMATLQKVANGSDAELTAINRQSLVQGIAIRARNNLMTAPISTTK